jgi:hypothetical protein
MSDDENEALPRRDFVSQRQKHIRIPLGFGMVSMQYKSRGCTLFFVVVKRTAKTPTGGSSRLFVLWRSGPSFCFRRDVENVVRNDWIREWFTALLDRILGLYPQRSIVRLTTGLGSFWSIGLEPLVK